MEKQHVREGISYYYYHYDCNYSRVVGEAFVVLDEIVIGFVCCLLENFGNDSRMKPGNS